MRIHFAGGGQCAEYIAKRLIREGHDLVLVEQDEQRCRELREVLDAQVLHGDVMQMGVWRDAGLGATDLFVACTHSDASNITAALIAYDMAPQAFKSVRLRSPEFREWQRMFDQLKVRVDRIVHPESDIVARIQRVLTIPGVADVRDFIDGRAKVFSMNVRHDSWLAGQSLDDLDKIPGSADARVCLILRAGQAIVPHGGEVIRTDDHIYVATTAELLDATLEFFGVGRREQVRQVFIIGGGEIGLELARALEQNKVAVKLFERDPVRCDYLAGELRYSLVVNLDGTEQELLLRENVEGADAFISLTGDDDANLIACLLARRLGVDKVVPLLNRINYLPLAQRLGINTTVSPRVKAADALLEFIRKGGVQSVRTLGGEQAEAIELEVPAGSRYIGIPLGEIDIPEGSLIAVIARPDGRVQVAHESDRIEAGDRVVLFAQEAAVRRLETELLDSSGRRGWLG